MSSGATPSVPDAVALYAAGWFPMDDDPSATRLPWYATHERALFDLGTDARGALRQRVRRSLRKCEAMTLRVDSAFEEVLALCATPRVDADDVWITPRLAGLYRRMHEAGFAHAFALHDEAGAVQAGVLGIVIGRAAMLESMRRVAPDAGNALLARTLDRLAQAGVELCDIQMATDHTRRLGARTVPREHYEARLAAAIAPRTGPL